MANEPHVYIAPDASGLNFHQAVGDKEVFIQFVDGNYRTDDNELAEAIDADIKAGHLSRWVRKVDKAAGEALVRAHIAMRAATGAQTGQSTSQSTANLNALQARDAELHKHGGDSTETVDALKNDSDLMLTEDASAQVDAPSQAAPAVKPKGINFAPKVNA